MKLCFKTLSTAKKCSERKVLTPSGYFSLLFSSTITEVPKPSNWIEGSWAKKVNVYVIPNYTILKWIKLDKKN